MSGAVFAVCDGCERDISYGEESSVVVVNREVSSLDGDETVVQIVDSEVAATLCHDCGSSLKIADIKAAATNG